MKFPFQSFPHIPQMGMECGTTSLAIIFRYYGLRNIQSLLAYLASVDQAGTSVNSLIEVARKFGFEADGYKIDYEDLQHVTMPCIVHTSGTHFMVLYKFDEKYVWLSDPSYGLRKLSKAEFEKIWSGATVNMEPTDLVFQNREIDDLLQAVQDNQNNVNQKYYKTPLKTYWKTIAEILGATFLVQLLALSLPIFTQSIIDNVFSTLNKNLLYSILLAMIFIFLLHLAITYTRNMLVVQFKTKFELVFFGNFFRHFIYLKQTYFDGHSSEDLIFRFAENQRVRQFLAPNTVRVFVDVIFILAYLILCFFYHIALAFLALILILIYIGIMAWVSPKLKNAEHKAAEASLKSLGGFLDTLLGILNVKMLGIEENRFYDWRNKQIHSLNVSMDSEKLFVGLDSVLTTVHFFSQICIYWVGAYLVLKQELSIGEYVAFITIFMTILNQLHIATDLWTSLTELYVSFIRLNDILVQPVEQNETQEVRLIPKKPDLIINNLSFTYNVSEAEYILKNINLQIKYGEKVGIVGRNGSGKTTLVKLIAQLYDQYEGNILLSHLNIRDIQPKVLRKRIFVFPQDIFIFNTTIKENISFGNPEASIEEIIEAAQKADIHDFVKLLYFGYNHRIGRGGTKLSGGQKLKIAFARLFLSNPDIIIIDEASSALDVESEAIILKNLYEKFADKTIISIAHRLNTLKTCDKLVILDKGEIMEIGSHKELIEQDGLYSQFVRTYVSY
jgi:ATP-binding cassette subfamily B protein